MSGILHLSQQGYLQKVVGRFKMYETKPVGIPLRNHILKLHLPKPHHVEEDRRDMKTSPYANGVGSIMYGMVYSKLDLTHAISVVSKFMEDPIHAH